MVTTQKKRSPHVLRHTFATSMLNHHADLQSVKELLGHESLSTTEVYTHTTFEELKAWYEKSGLPLKKFFNTSGMQYKALQLKDKLPTMSEEEQLVHMRDYLIVEMLYQTGMRRAELVGLKDTDVDTRQQQIRVFGKRAKERIVPMGETLCELIDEYRTKKQKIVGEQEGIGTFLVRKNRKGEWQAMDAHTLYNIVRARMGEVSTLKKHSPHVLRHTFATTMLNNGADIRTIQSLLGHASLAATQVYTHATFEQMKEAYHAAHPRSKK